MPATQAEINERVAVALERLNGRMEMIEKWREESDERRERAEERHDRREDKRPEMTRADAALAISGATGIVYLLMLVAQHWH